jgi:hypothetical protein
MAPPAIAALSQGDVGDVASRLDAALVSQEWRPVEA